jgi:hypothetical protein
MKRYAFVGGLMAVTLASSGAYAANEFVTDGQFENGSFNGASGSDLTDWTATGLTRVFNNADQPEGLGLWANTTSGNGWNGMTASGAGYFVALDGAFPTPSDNATLSQTVTGLTVGDKYTLSFNLAFGQERDGPSGDFFNGDTINSLTASVGSASMNSGNVDLASHGFVPWTTETLNFTATSTSELLSFVAFANVSAPSYALVSDVSLTSAAAPEPSTWAMMVIGFGGLGYAAYRTRRKRVAVAA